MNLRFLLLALVAAAAVMVVDGGMVLAQTPKTEEKIQPVNPDDGYKPFVRSKNPMGWNIPYHFSQNGSDPTYQIARKIMDPMYKKAPIRLFGDPLMGVGEIDLNNDKLPEIISFPTEQEEEYGAYCTINYLCPHYIIQIQEKKAAVLGILYGYKVNRGDRIKNGYYTLKAFTAPKKDRNFFKEYSYNPKTNEYELVK